MTRSRLYLIESWTRPHIHVNKISEVMIIRRAMKFIDIGANLTDSMFRGVYGGTSKHPDDFNQILTRSWDTGLQKIIITVGTLAEIEEAVTLTKTCPDKLYTTLGVHPTRCGEFDSADNPEAHFQRLCESLDQHREHIVALGELGLDYDRLHFCDKDTQRKYFEKQLDLCSRYDLPLFLHSRNCHGDFVEILRRNLDKIKRFGVVHSFTGSWDEADELIRLGFSIGINGCSLKTAENLEMAKRIPGDKLMLETDAPWCGIRPSHAGAKFVETKLATVKRKEKWTKDSLIDGRNEPCQIVQVIEVLAAIRNESKEALADTIYKNTLRMFFPDAAAD